MKSQKARASGAGAADRGIFHGSIKDSLTANKNVYLRGFGSFIVKKRAEKVARNISKNTTITIPAHNIPAFKPAKSFAGKVKANTIVTLFIKFFNHAKR
ncbi:MAG: HU family DNA-binding protein [Alistipes sp.]